MSTLVATVLRVGVVTMFCSGQRLSAQDLPVRVSHSGYAVPFAVLESTNAVTGVWDFFHSDGNGTYLSSLWDGFGRLCVGQVCAAS
jgi:hypothetical protein